MSSSLEEEKVFPSGLEIGKSSTTPEETEQITSTENKSASQQGSEYGMAPRTIVGDEILKSHADSKDEKTQKIDSTSPKTSPTPDKDEESSIRSEKPSFIPTSIPEIHHENKKVTSESMKDSHAIDDTTDSIVKLPSEIPTDEPSDHQISDATSQETSSFGIPFREDSSEVIEKEQDEKIISEIVCSEDSLRGKLFIVCVCCLLSILNRKLWSRAMCSSCASSSESFSHEKFLYFDVFLGNVCIFNLLPGHCCPV